MALVNEKRLKELEAELAVIYRPLGAIASPSKDAVVDLIDTVRELAGVLAEMIDWFPSDYQSVEDLENPKNLMHERWVRWNSVMKAVTHGAGE